MAAVGSRPFEEMFGQRRPRMAVIVHLAADSSAALERSKVRLATASEQLLPQAAKPFMVSNRFAIARFLTFSIFFNYTMYTPYVWIIQSCSKMKMK